MNDILDRIVEQRRKDVALKTIPVSELKARHRDRAGFRAFHKALLQRMRHPLATAIIAEIKRGSPAKGLFAADLDPAATAKDYETGGAACLSVLTEPRWFFGSFDDLNTARRSSTLPVLQKDFIVTGYQVYEAAIHADAVLLIARCLDGSQIGDLYGLAAELGLDALVEVFDEDDLDKIEPFHFPLIGVNHRNLRTMKIDLERSREMVSRFGPGQTAVAASGIQTRNDIEMLIRTGIRSFLIGESLSIHRDRVGFLRGLVEGEKSC